MSGKDKNLGGRPTTEIDFNKLDNLLKIQCTGEECASVMDVSYSTLTRRVMEKFGIGFEEYSTQKRAGGKMSLRRRQLEMAQDNPTMAIWLGKQYLGQSDKAENKHSGEIKIKKIEVEYLDGAIKNKDKSDQSS